MMAEMICDQIVIGIHNEGMRKRLLADPNLTLKKAVELLIIEEQVEKDSKSMESNKGYKESVYKIDNNQSCTG